MAARHNIQTNHKDLDGTWVEIVGIDRTMLIYTPSEDVHIVRGHSTPTEDNYFLVPAGSTINFEYGASGQTWMRAPTATKIYMMGG